MPVERGQAQAGQTVTLRGRFKLAGTLADPDSMDQVRILAPDETTILTTVPSGSIVKDGVGLYRVVYAIPSAAELATHFDRWFVTWSPGATQEQFTLHFFVMSATATAATSPYLTTTELMDYLPAGVDLTSAQVTSLGALAQEVVETIAGHHFLPREMARTFNGTGMRVLPVDRRLRSVSTIEFRACSAIWQTQSYTDVRILPSGKMISLGNALSVRQGAYYAGDAARCGCSSSSSCGYFPAGVQNVRITGTWGHFASVPEQIKDAVGQLVRHAASCDDPHGQMGTDFAAENVPGGRAYTARQILRQAKVDRSTGYSQIDATLMRFAYDGRTVTVM